MVQPIDPQSPRSFVQFILEPFYKMVAQAVGEHPRDVEAMFDKLGVKVRRLPQWLVWLAPCWVAPVLHWVATACAALHGVATWRPVLRQLKPQVYHWDSKPLLKTALHQFFGRFGVSFGPTDRPTVAATARRPLLWTEPVEETATGDQPAIECQNLWLQKKSLCSSMGNPRAVHAPSEKIIVICMLGPPRRVRRCGRLGG